MKLFVAVALFVQLSAFAGEAFPKKPETTITPGTLCSNPDERRYPEKIAYCNRGVSSNLKAEIIRTYDANFGYKVGSMNRQLFKIDHYIPLCMGGSNDPKNLWPQHETVYKVTDPLEQTACEKMAAGKLKQADAVELVKKAKANLDEAIKILSQVQSL